MKRKKYPRYKKLTHMIEDAFKSLNIVQEKNVFKKGGVVIDQARVSTAIQGFAFRYNQNIPIVRGRKTRKPLRLDSIRKYFMGDMKHFVKINLQL